MNVMGVVLEGENEVNLRYLSSSMMQDVWKIDICYLFEVLR